jgi:apolipoprotein N-acyltransferase
VLFRKLSIWKSALLGYIFGATLCAIGASWASYYTVDALIKIVLYGGLPYGIWFGLISAFQFSLAPANKTLHLWIRSIIPAGSWIIVFAFTQLLPIGSIVIEVPLYQPLALMQLASIGSIWPVAILVLWFNAALALCFIKRTNVTTTILCISAILSLCCATWGALRLHNNPHKTQNMKIALVQPNFPPESDWRDAHGDEIMDTTSRMIREAGRKNPKIIFLPQYGLPIDPYRDEEFFSNLANETSATIVLAAYIPHKEGTTYQESGMANMGMVYEPQQGRTDAYISVVGPPFRDINQQFGNTYPELGTPLGTMGLLLCYEDTVRWTAKQWSARDVDFFASITNTGKFQGSTLPRHHFMQARMRAIENNVPVIRVSPNGYSGIIDKYGRVRVQTTLDSQEVIFDSI